MEKKRYIDVLKGLGMTMVIIGHAYHSGHLHKYVVSFHMPLFFFISGYLFNPHRYSTIGVLIKTKLKVLIIPYFFFGMISLPVGFCEGLILRNEFSIVENLIGLFTFGTYGTIYNGVIWFLLALFQLYIGTYYIIKIAKDKWYMILQIGIIITLLSVFITCNNFFGNWSTVSGVTIFFFAGNLFRRVENKVIQQNCFINFLFGLCLITFGIITAIYFNNEVTVSAAEFGSNRFIFYISSFLSILGWFTLSKIFTYIIEGSFTERIISYMGVNSIIVMGIHGPYGLKLFGLLSHIVHIDFQLLDVVGTSAVSLIIILIFRRSKILENIEKLIMQQPLFTIISKIQERQRV